MPNKSHTNLSIIEAVETLSSIADLEFDRDVGITQRREIVLQDETIAYNKTIHWLHEQDAMATVNLVRETFRVILHYLKQFYRKEYGYITDPKTIEGIKTIMVLVGEAAKKLDKYTHLFHQAHSKSVTEFKEYKQLQDFYLSKISRKIDEGVLGKWILGLSLNKIHQPEALIGSAIAPAKTEAKFPEIKHVFIDLEVVKRDIEYELFFIRKEDSSRFFSSRLLRSIKLVCDFGGYFGEQKGIDPLENVKLWLDRTLNVSACDIIKALGGRLDYFFREICKKKNEELVDIVNKAILALMLSSHTHNVMTHHPIKSCSEYFDDFQFFLRQALQSHTYQKWIVYPPKQEDVLATNLLDLIHHICRIFYSHLQGLQELISIIHVLIHDASLQQSSEHRVEANLSKQIWSRLAGDYAAMNKLFKRHPNGALFKVLELLEQSSFPAYDPLLQHNIPNQLFDLYIHTKRITTLRFAAPVYQAFINKAQIVEEFKGFLRSYHQAPQSVHLLINLQDRTSWLEHARCTALEELQFHTDMKDVLSVATLATETDFYHQLAPYHQINHADVFIDQFKQHLKGEGTGFYFPPSINTTELSTFIDKTFEAVHRIFFSNKNVLSREHRLDFIEICYLFLILKLIDMVNPDSFSLNCKDGIDSGPLYAGELYIFLKMVNGSSWVEHEMDYLNFMIYAPALLIRERIVLPEHFNRMISAIRTIENAQHEFGRNFPAVIQEGFFASFKLPVLQSTLLLPNSALSH